MDEAMAYRVQSEFVEKMIERSPLSGFKGALTNRAAQTAMGLNKPASGVLLKEMEWPEGSTIGRREFYRPILETEIGVVIGSDITTHVSEAELPGYIDYYQPMVEIADIGVDHSASVFDFIAGNSAAAGYIAGGKSTIREVDDVLVRFFKDGELLHEGRGSDAMGSQAAATVWLINQLVDQGYAIRQGHILMTGSLGRVNMQTEPGLYLADFEKFGRIQFEIS
jgi:2-keto-4-pentenoate hydratase